MAIYDRYGRVLTDEEKAERDKLRELEAEARRRELEADDFMDELLPLLIESKPRIG